jgi:hypothetical protein
MELRSVKVWLYGLLSAVISSAAGATAVVWVDPDHFNFTTGLRHLLLVSAALGVVALFNYLQRHPLPEWDGVTERRTFS